MGLALALLAGCQPLPHPFADDRPPAALLAVPDSIDIAVGSCEGEPRAAGRHQGWIGEVSLIPWLVLMAAAMLALGYVTAVSCRNLAGSAADREREAAEHAMRARVGGVTHDLVLLATGREIAQYERFRKELAVAAGQRGA